MPYDVVGNAGGRSTSRAARDLGLGSSGNRNHTRRGVNLHNRYGSTSSYRSPTACRIMDCARFLFFLFFIGGGIMLFVGLSKILSATTDSRGQLLQTWSDTVTDWTTTHSSEFTSLKPTLTTTASTTAIPLTDATTTITPKSFGETSWSTKKITTPSSVIDHTWSGKASCPGKVPNQLCTLTLASSSGKTITTRNFTPRKQVGPIQHSISSKMCQWYDSDYWHPMASLGMGKCNNVRSSSQSYNFGPSSCVDDHYLDSDGCPNDVIQTSQWVKAGWSWASNSHVQLAVNNQKRFTYDSGKCWDYSDCFCSGCGNTFKTDISKGWGFTGYGYWYNNQWTSFPKPFSSMTNTQKAQQCSQQFDHMGLHCPASDVNLICFRAGGYPKKKCSTYCHEQDRTTAVYTPPKTYVEMHSYYGPWGIWSGKYPVYTSTEARCDYSKTTTTTITSLNIALNDKSTAALTTGSKWVVGNQFAETEDVKGTVPFSTISDLVTVDINVRSSVGPVMEGIVITDGCGPAPPVTGTPYRCFGPSQSEKIISGIIFIVIGSLLLCGPVVLAYFVTKGVINCLNGGGGGSSTNAPMAQQSYVQPQQYQQQQQGQKPIQQVPLAPQQQQYYPPQPNIPIAQPIAYVK